MYPFEFFYEALFGLVSLLFATIAVISIKSKFQLDEYFSRHYLKGFWLSVGGALAIISVYLFIYGGGDTKVYFNHTRTIFLFLVDDFGEGVDLLFFNERPENFVIKARENVGKGPSLRLFQGGNEHFVGVFSLPFYLLGFGSFVGTSIWIAAFSFACRVLLYKSLHRTFKENPNHLFLATMAIPSILLWSTAIFKETFIMSGVCLMIYGYVKFENKQARLQNFLLVGIGYFLISNVRGFMTTTLIPMFLILWAFKFVDRKRGSSKAVLPAFAFMSFLMAMGVLFLQPESLLGETGIVQQLEEMSVKANDLSRDYYYEGQGSRYDIGQFDGSISSFVTVAPVALFTALFRPFPWEVPNMISVPYAIENFVIFILFLRTMLSVGVGRFFNLLLQNRYPLAMLSSILALGVVVGIASGNYGNLMRYRVPMLLLYVLLVVVIRAIARREDVQGGTASQPARPPAGGSAHGGLPQPVPRSTEGL